MAKSPSSSHRPSSRGAADGAIAARDGEAARLTGELIGQRESRLPQADADAHYAKEIEFDLAAVTPFVAGPNEVKTIVPGNFKRRLQRHHTRLLPAGINYPYFRCIYLFVAPDALCCCDTSYLLTKTMTAAQTTGFRPVHHRGTRIL